MAPVVVAMVLVENVAHWEEDWDLAGVLVLAELELLVALQEGFHKYHPYIHNHLVAQKKNWRLIMLIMKLIMIF